VLVILDKATCRSVGRKVEPLAESLVHAGARFFWYRNNIDPPLAQYEEVVRVSKVVTASGGELMVGDRADIAIAAHAAGVHLPTQGIPVEAARTLPGVRRIGCSCHSAAEVSRAERSGADYITLSPVFPTTGTKPIVQNPLGVAKLGELARATRVPIYALGGIDVGRAATCLVAGAYGVAVLGSIVLAPRPEKEFQRLFEVVTIALRGADSQ
jgi:thiamine-phosphate pyrophosphorylase